MKATLFSAGLALILAGCSSELETASTTTMSGIDISIQEDLVTRTLASKTNRLSCILTDTAGIRAQQSQVSSDSDYGSLHFDVPKGAYSLLIFASRESDYTVDDDANIRLGKRGDSYSYSTTVNVGNEKRENLSPELTRCSCRLILSSTDTIPSTVKQVQFQLEGVSSIYDIAKGLGTDETVYESGMATLTTSLGITSEGKFKVNTNQILPAASKDVKVILTFYDADSQQVRQIQKTVTLRKNVQTTLSGPMFINRGADAAIGIDENWNNPEEVEL